MEIKKLESKIKCDMPACKNLAELSVINGDNKRYAMHFCKSCLNNLYAEFAKLVTPKSIKTIYQKHKGELNEN